MSNFGRKSMRGNKLERREWKKRKPDKNYSHTDCLRENLLFFVVVAAACGYLLAPNRNRT